MKKYNKLVRDKIPDIIKTSGLIPTMHTATDEEYTDALAKKLIEEANEFKESGETEELVDILEVIDAICAFKSINHNKLRQIQITKAQKRGSFSQKIILEKVEK